MKCKRLLKFYFYAEGLNAALDRLIAAVAVKSYEVEGNGAECTESILSIIEAKDELCRLWNYLDKVIRSLSGDEIDTLRYYGGLRVGIRKLGKDKVREIKRALIKFRRRARFAERYQRGIELIREYYCLLDSSA
ncbi:MAG: hypothetical protein K2K80_08205 [Clostridia bacterium]|nr:hypothetical protein [Clostridia bacterium]